MKIEVVEFYQNESPKEGVIKGTLHVYICDLELDYRGIGVIKDKDKWYFFYPFRKTPKNEKGHWIPYPIIKFTDEAKNIALKKAIESQGKKYIQKLLKHSV